MLFQKMLEVNTTHPIANLNKKDAKKSLLTASFPKWCQRQSDLPTYACIEEAKSFGYRPQIQEKFRASNGYLKVSFEESYWFCIPMLTEEFKKTEKGIQCEEDFTTMAGKGNVYLNTSNYSSEKRHAIAVAKAASVIYDLAFSEIEDVEAVDLSTLQNTKRRNEVYKFYGRMRQDFNEEGKSLEQIGGEKGENEIPNSPTDENQQVVNQATTDGETKDQVSVTAEASMPQIGDTNVQEQVETKDQAQEQVTETLEEKKKRITDALANGTFNVDDLIKDISNKK